MLSRKLFTSRGQGGIANGDELETWRGLAIFGELLLVSQRIILTITHISAPDWRRCPVPVGHYLDLQLLLLVLVLDELKPGLVFG